MSSSFKVILPIIIVLLAGAGYFYFSQQEENPQQQAIKTQVKKGEFKVHVIATGELKAKRSEKIKGPQGMRSAQIYQTNLTDLIPEGKEDGRYRVELFEAVYSGENRVPILELAVRETGKEKSIAYSWADRSSERIGINIRSMQVGCTRQP